MPLLMNQSATTPWARLALSSARITATVEDVVRAAHFRGELKKPWVNLLASLAAEQLAEEAGETPDEAALQEMSEQFRFESDLISAEETEEWLSARGLTLSDFSAYFVRQYSLKQGGDTPDAPHEDILTAPEELRDLLLVDLILGGEFDRMATHLAWRIAAREEARGDNPEKEVIERERKEFHRRQGIDQDSEAEWLAALRCNREWLEEMLTAEAEFRRQSAAATTQDALDRMMVTLRMPLTRFVVELMEVESLDAAREALLCVREDRLALAEVAKMGGYPHRQAKLRYENLGEDVQHAFLRATPGEVLDPFDLGDGFQLCRMIEKLEPSIDEPVVRARLETEIIARNFTELAAKHVRFALGQAIE